MEDRVGRGPRGRRGPPRAPVGLEVRVLGALEIVVDGVAVPLRGTVRRRLVLALVAAPGWSTVEELVEVLWPGRRPDETGLNAVHAQVSRLRRLLGPPGVGSRRLVSEGTRYRLLPDRVDAEDLERRIEAADALVATDPGGARALLRGVLDAVRAPVVEDLPAWEALVHHWQLRWRHAEETWAGLVVGSADVGTRADELLALARAEPTREVRWALAMRALALAGRQADALAAYREARRRLLEEVGVEPGPDLRLTHEGVLRQSRLQRDPWGPAIGGAITPTTSFVGRGADLERLDRIVGRDRIVTVHGLGGMGKTRLVAEWVTRSGRSGSTRWVDLRGARAESLTHRVAVQIGLAPAEHSARTSLEAIVVSAPALPVVLVLDAADDVAEAAGALALTLTSCLPQLTVLTTARHPLGVTGERAVLLGPLTPDDAERLAVHRLGEGGGDASSVARRSGGVPLAVEVLAARPDAPLAGSGHPVADLEEAVQDAVLGLSGEAAGVFDRLRVLPSGARSELVHRLLRRPDERTSRRVLGELVSASLVVTEPHLTPTGVAELRHRVLQPVVDLARTASAEHEAWTTFGDWLLEHVPSAHGETPDWARVRVVADEQTNLEAALTSWQAEDPVRLLHVVVRLAQWWGWSGQSALGHRWIETGRLAADGAAGIGPDGRTGTTGGTGPVEIPPALRAEALLVGSTGRGLGHLASSGAELDAAAALLGPHDDPGLRAGVLGLRAVTRGWRGDLEGFDADIKAARVLSAEVDRPWIDVHLDSAAALSRAGRGEPGAAIEGLLTVADAFGALGDGHARTVALHFAVTIASLVGDERLDGLLDRAQEAAAVDGSPAGRALIAGEAAKHGLRRAVRAGVDGPDLVERMERAAVDLERVGNGRTAAVVRRDLGLHLLARGAPRRAEEELRTAAGRLLVLDPGAAALAVAGLAVVLDPAATSQLVAAAWALSVGGGTPLLAPDREVLSTLTGLPGPPPASHAEPTGAVDGTVDAVLAVLEVPRLDLGA